MASSWSQNYELYKRYTRNLAAMYQKKQEVRAFVELLLSLSAITVFGVFAIRPTIVTILDLNNQISGKEETIKLMDTKIQALAEAQEIYTRNVNTLPLIDIGVPPKPSPEIFIRQVEGLASKHSLFILDMNTKNVPILSATSSSPPSDEEAVSTDPYPESGESFQFQITAIGSYAGVHAFLNDFEFLKRAMFEDVVSIRLAQGELPGELTISLVGRLPYLPDEH